jgi:hypothetical protein
MHVASEISTQHRSLLANDRGTEKKAAKRTEHYLGLVASELGVVERRLQVRRHAVDDVTVGTLHAERAKRQPD